MGIPHASCCSARHGRDYLADFKRLKSSDKSSCCTRESEKIKQLLTRELCVMPVVGSEAYILADLGKTRDVYPYTPDYKPIQVQMVDAAVRYESPFDGKVYILVIMNVLYVPSMKYNLVPPFVKREAGIIVRDTPKIHMEEPTEEGHALTFPETGFRIPLSLTGTFSFFPTPKPSTNNLIDPEEVYILTPLT
jgi:hypothetical protein